MKAPVEERFEIKDGTAGASFAPEASVEAT
jgi:hypothetical protein